MKTINVKKTLCFLIFLFVVLSGSLVIGATQQKFPWPMFLSAIIAGNQDIPPTPPTTPSCVAKTPVVPGAVGNTQPFFLFQEGLSIAPQQWDGWSYIVADFDGDSDQDIIRFEYSYPPSTPYSGELTIIENQNGTLIINTEQWIENSIIPDHPRDYEIADFDGDGSEEIFVAQHGYDADPFPGAPNMLLKVVNGKLIDASSTNLIPNETNGFTHGAAKGDVDCDGDIDLFSLEGGGRPSYTHLYLNNKGTFTIKENSIPVEYLVGYQESAFIDFDLDGDPDLLLGAQSREPQSQTVLLVNDGTGSFSFSDSISLPAPYYPEHHAINSAKAADFTGDGYPDLIVFEIPHPFSTTSVIRLWKNQKNGNFIDVTTAWGLPSECTGEVIEPLFVNDLNNDGWIDFVIPLGCQETGDGPAIAMNTGNDFNITPMSIFKPYFNYAQPYPIDIDSDGDLDLFLDQGGGPAVLKNTTIE